MNTLLKKIIISVLAVALVAFLVIGIPLKNTKYTYATTQSFTKDGFVESMELSNTEKLVAENGKYQLFIDETTSYITLVDKVSGTKWQSNPTIEDPTEPIIAAKNKQKATLEYSYYNDAGSITSVNNYTLSIYHPASVTTPEGQRTFAIKYIESENAVQVLYTMKNLEISFLYFPKYLSEAQLAEFESRDANRLKSLAYTKYEEKDMNGDGQFTDDEKFYFIEKYDSSMTLLLKRNLYEILYTKYGYTLDRVAEENALHEIFDEEERVEFQMAVQIKLLDSGIEAKILRESIVEVGAHLAEVSLYPLFGTAIAIDEENKPTEGYLVVPDGAGAVIEFNNTKTSQNAYRKRLYGTDLSLMPFSMPEEQQKINIPVYGMVKKNVGGFAAIITEGDAMAYINADISGRIDAYNKIYTSFQLRETESVVLGTGYNRYGVTLWTKDIVKSDFAVNYTFLKGNENSYVGIANVYRNYLINNLGMEQKDNTTKTVLTAEFIGAFDKQSFFLGVPYSTLDSLTTFEQAKEIIEKLQDRNVTHLNVSYLGVSNGGLSNLMFDRNEVADVLGGKSGLDSLNTYLNDLDIDLYQHANFVTTTKYRGFVDSFRYNSMRVRGSSAMYFVYHVPSKLPSSEFDKENILDQYVLNPLLYEAMYKNFTKQSNVSGLALDFVGSSLASHYDYNKTLYKQDALNLQKNLLEIMNEEILLSNPLGFALPYASFVNDLPTETTLYALIDYQIPLLQLVLSGLVDYTSESINLTSNRSTQYQFLKVLETGSNLKYTLSYESSQKLLNTKHNQYMSTHYVNWLDQIENQIEIVDSLKLHEGVLVNHERLQNNVYKVTYSNGLEIMINYNQYAVTVGTHHVTGMNYVVIGGAN
ncbi:DUF5696 domain-containing protein [Acholeplasma hippikon]|uniref:Uncharacterized protein n=1 Tax=Acholeplasma hippikon TaxID=264636 RepID=A0A449BK32_9MOLU|nr:DUF5696 domain-containing protein [Acholeplasma hippikon]VEU82808.1 Uncharacterised protein [Acholeplasma hippikon]